MSQVIWTGKATEEELPAVAQKIAEMLSTRNNFCLWMNGQMGAGKTTLTRFILREFGLPDIIPVTSPTFAYINEYEIQDKTFAHLDLYRVEENFSPEDLGLDEDREIKGTFVEWPEKISKHSTLSATHSLQIDVSDDLSFREYSLSLV